MRSSSTGGGQAAIGYQRGFLRVEAEFGRTTNHSDAYTAISPISATLPQDGSNEGLALHAQRLCRAAAGTMDREPRSRASASAAARGHVTGPSPRRRARPRRRLRN
ncbi:MAG: hypothetical protein WDN24_06240 [Sphingomonas sp.]